MAALVGHGVLAYTMSSEDTRQLNSTVPCANAVAVGAHHFALLDLGQQGLHALTLRDVLHLLTTNVVKVESYAMGIVATVHAPSLQLDPCRMFTDVVLVILVPGAAILAITLWIQFVPSRETLKAPLTPGFPP